MRRIIYQGRKVTAHWYGRHVEKRKPAAPKVSKPRRRPAPIIATILLPRIPMIREDRDELRTVDLALPLYQWDVEAWRDAYLTPPCTELPTFFPNHP
jgi:hypothetical protein